MNILHISINLSLINDFNKVTHNNWKGNLLDNIGIWLANNVKDVINKSEKYVLFKKNS